MIRTIVAVRVDRTPSWPGLRQSSVRIKRVRSSAIRPMGENSWFMRNVVCPHRYSTRVLGKTNCSAEARACRTSSMRSSASSRPTELYELAPHQRTKPINLCSNGSGKAAGCVHLVGAHWSEPVIKQIGPFIRLRLMVVGFRRGRVNTFGRTLRAHPTNDCFRQEYEQQRGRYRPVLTRGRCSSATVMTNRSSFFPQFM